MEIPEKIYLQDSMSTDTIGDLWPEWFDAKVSDNSIEYIRTDVFINKACKWLNNFYNNETRSYLIAEDIQEFKESMKGE